MNLMTKELTAKLPGLGKTDGKKDAKAVLKIFDPCGRMTFYACEYDGEDTLFGYMISPLGPECDEWGYSSLAEFRSVKGPLGIGLERDLHWNSDTLMSDVSN